MRRAALSRIALCHRSLRYASVAMLFATTTLAACGSDSATGPSTQEVAGTYEAIIFTITFPSGPLDELNNGGFVNLVLMPDGTTAGQLFLSGAGGLGSDIDESLDGTWSLSADTLRLSAAADTVLRDVTLTAYEKVTTGEREIIGVGTFGDYPVRIVMREHPTAD